MIAYPPEDNPRDDEPIEIPWQDNSEDDFESDEEEED